MEKTVIIFNSRYPKIHPEVKRVNRKSVTWAEEMGIISADQMGLLESEKIAWLTARGFPDLDFDVLQMATDWTVLFCLLDDHIENLQGSDSVMNFLAEVLQVLKYGTCPSGALGDCGFLRAAGDLHRRFFAIGSTEWIEQLIQRVGALFSAFHEESVRRHAGKPSSLADYLRLREETVGLQVLFEFFYLKGTNVEGSTPSSCFRSRDLSRQASRIVGMENDIFTIGKELDSGDQSNVILSIMTELDVSIRVAMDEAVRMYEMEISSFAIKCRNLKFDSDESSLGAYALMLTDWINGHSIWARETARYH
ncbi:terpene synthase family protein [Streptomyces virginiae]|uniref:terpene synthase family protein n=1 Tax=Streptomyces virginiae TaxID=1961 RepID=UPI0036CC28D2